MQQSLRKWELWGIVVIVLLGGFSHFAFEITGRWPPAGFFFAVNESVWEHLKLTFWPTIIYSLLSYGFLRSASYNYLIARAAALVAMPATILILFYGYTTITGLESLAVDIAIFVIAVAVGQLTAWRIMAARRLPFLLSIIAVMVIISLAVTYGIFTWYPPHIGLFLDTPTGTYGIP